ncbi:hypothetical protein Cni_G11005 [Canna indica]|uniref:Uncharacterized protein n=1 Tax=Canna indica TaxID=4628 RepID=A0AAQ3Q7T0_9LILI|nr:hypothetical protein Cni_G11005 [Canna indica]
MLSSFKKIIFHFIGFEMLQGTRKWEYEKDAVPYQTKRGKMHVKKAPRLTSVPKTTKKGKQWPMAELVAVAMYFRTASCFVLSNRSHRVQGTEPSSIARTVSTCLRRDAVPKNMHMMTLQNG